MRKYGFKIFLIVYLLFFLQHTLVGGFTKIGILGLIAGISVAFIAHSRASHFTTALLLAHILIEWVEYSNHGVHFSTKELVLYGVHTILDFVLLWNILKRPIREYIVGGLAMGILILLISTNIEIEKHYGNAEMHEEKHEHKHNGNFLELFVVGGIIGCTVYHIAEKRKRD